jgi:hypothetical protein
MLYVTPNNRKKKKKNLKVTQKQTKPQKLIGKANEMKTALIKLLETLKCQDGVDLVISWKIRTNSLINLGD